MTYTELTYSAQLSARLARIEEKLKELIERNEDLKEELSCLSD